MQIRRAERRTAVLLTVTVFVLLCAYYILKTVREGLILGGGTFGLRGDELKVYATGGMAVVLAVIVPAYSVFASRVSRIALIRATYAIAIASLIAFYVLGRAGVPIGLPFYLWLGIASMLLVAQFWSYASDLFSELRGRRVFATIGIGGSLGAIAGPRLATLADTWTLLVLACVLLAICIALFSLAEIVAPPPVTPLASLAREGGFALIARDGYLMLIAALVVVASLVNTIGELLLSTAATDAAAHLDGAAKRESIKAFYADFYSWVTVLGFLSQALLVSRVLAIAGGRAALFVVPAIAIIGYAAIGLAGGLAVVRVVNIIENAADYSVQNTARHALFLPLSRDAKYKAKAAIDTSFVRLGDLAAAVIVGIALRGLALSPAALATTTSCSRRCGSRSPRRSRPDRRPLLHVRGTARRRRR